MAQDRRHPRGNGERSRHERTAGDERGDCRHGAAFPRLAVAAIVMAPALLRHLGSRAVGVTENKALVLRFYAEVWGRGNVAYAHDVFADDYVRHDLRPTDPPPGAAGQARIAEDVRRAFPDLEWHVGGSGRPTGCR
jgi:hypothetical protein